MNFKSILLVLGLLPFQTGFGQTISLSGKNISLQDVLEKVSQQTGYIVLAKKHWFNNCHSLTLNVTNSSLEEVLAICFRGQPVTYSKIDSTIVLQPLPIQGRITNEKGEALESVTITVKGTDRSGETNSNGEYLLNGAAVDTALIFTCVNMETIEKKLKGQTTLHITMQTKVKYLDETTISGYDGYQPLPKERVTGSFYHLDHNDINYRVTYNALDRMDGMASGVNFQKTGRPGTNYSPFSIRGQATILANPNPLIVLDNFPFEGNPGSINPNDIESITILKDAAATSSWGVLSGNGVIVITTKKARYNQRKELSFKSNLTITDKPVNKYGDELSSGDYVDVERYLFSEGHYDETLNSGYGRVSPTVELLNQHRNGKIGEAQLNDELSKLAKTNVYNDMERLFFRRAVWQQYALNVSGGNAYTNYYISASYDRSALNQPGSRLDRKIISSKFTTRLNKTLELTSDLTYANQYTRNSKFQPLVLYPYLQLADDAGKPLTVPADIRQNWKDTGKKAYLLDWDYRPLEEQRLKNTRQTENTWRLNLSVKYNLFNKLQVTAYYQYHYSDGRYHDNQHVDSYNFRHLYNKFTSLQGDGIKHAIPYGGIIDATINQLNAHYGRLQLDFSHRQHVFNISAVAGMEIRSTRTDTGTTRTYGYQDGSAAGISVDFDKLYPFYYDADQFDYIPGKPGFVSVYDRHLSTFLNTGLAIKSKYSVTASVRIDKTNVFGVKTNQRWIPLWSAGISWNLGNEWFYGLKKLLPYLKFRANIGVNGNTDRSISPQLTATRHQISNIPVVSVITPANPDLGWEKILMLNAGFDFHFKKRCIEGSIEYYRRYGRNLIGESPLDPITGNTVFRGNSAQLNGNGLDLTLTTKNSTGPIRWNSYLLLSYATNKVIKYDRPLDKSWYFTNEYYYAPRANAPVHSVYATKWGGLDPVNGDPLGYLNDTISKRYTDIMNGSPDGLILMGTADPRIFGSLRNRFCYGEIEMSFTLAYKLGHYFRARSVNYSALFNAEGPGHTDYTKRWVRSGDEQHTNVPSLKYPAVNNRDEFYLSSEILVQKADCIKLQDIRIQWNYQRKKGSRMPFHTAEIYLYAQNLGILWKATRADIDPDYLSGFPTPKSITLGIKLDL